MLIVSIFIILSLLSFNDESKPIDIKISFLGLLVLSIIFVYRASDFPMYMNFYLNIEPLTQVFSGKNQYFVNNKSQLEFGYKLFNSMFKIFTSHVEYFFYFLNGTVLLIVYNFFKGRSINTFKLLLPYFIFLYISVQVGIARQMIAISIFYFSIRYIIQRDFLRFFLCTLVAISFHRSSVVLPVFYFIAFREYSVKFMIITFILGMLIFLEVIPFKPLQIVEWINQRIPNEFINRKISFYVWQSQNLPVPSKLNRGIFENTIIFSLLVYIKYYLNKEQLYDKFTNIALNLSLLYIFVYIYFFEISSFSYRLNYYLIFFKFFVIVKYIESLKLPANRLVANALLVIYCGLMMIIRISQGY